MVARGKLNFSYSTFSFSFIPEELSFILFYFFMDLIGNLVDNLFTNIGLTVNLTYKLLDSVQSIYEETATIQESQSSKNYST